MAQLGIPYIITGPDGTRAVFNEPNDPDFVGYVDSESGITGLLDTASVRQGYFDKPESHGGVQTNSYFSQRVGTIQGFVIPEPNMATYNNRESKLKKATRGMVGDEPCIMTWTPDGSSTRRMRLYRQEKIQLTGRRPKKFVVPMSSPDAFVTSAALHEQTIMPGGGSGDNGITSPISSPLTTSFATSSEDIVNNEGDAEAGLEAILMGPCKNPTFENSTSGLKFTINIEMPEGSFLIVNTELGTVFYEAFEGSGAVNRYSLYYQNIETNKWWGLLPGPNLVRLLASSFTEGTTAVNLLWRDTWE